jgi:oxygen-independent coproporphyrinogen III oxidase
MTQSRNLPVVSEGAESYVPAFPWDRGIEEASLSTKRGFVFQFPPFPALESTDADVVDRRTPAGLYAHVPFCPYRCSYCYYAVELNQPADAVTAYLDLLEAEMALVAARPAVRRHQLTTAFIGGGTPTQLSTQELARLVEALHARLDLSALAEFTVESDPTTITLDKVVALRERGVNRISIGVQTFADELNELNQRRHGAAETMAAIDAVRRAGIDNLNLDLICGLIGETPDNWRATIDQLLAIAPEHVTIYLFSFRPQTSAFVRVAKGKLPAPPEEAMRIAMYVEARDRLLAAGYTQTTANCFVREPRWEQIHQRNAWSSLPLVGLGNSAYSFIDDCVTQNVRSLGAYSQAVARGKIPVELGHRLTARELMIRYCVLRFKQLSISRSAFQTRFGFDIDDVIGKELANLTRLGLVECSQDRVVLTAKGIVYVDDVCREIYTPEVRNRMQAIENAALPELVKSLV